MGIIYKQSFRGTVLVYLGVIIGFITTGLIFPKVLEPKQIGLINIIVTYALVFSQIGLLGLQTITTRLFTYFRDEEKKHKGFFFIGITIALLGFLLITTIFIFIKPYLLNKGIEKSNLLGQYINYIIPLVFFLILFDFFDVYYKMLFNAVKGIFLKEFIRRFFLLIVITLFYFHLLNYHEFIISYIIAFCLPTILIFISLLRIRQISFRPTLKYLNSSMIKTIAGMGFFGLFSNTTSILNIHTERILVDHYLGLRFLGIYTTIYIFGSLVGMPSRMVKRISSVFIADAWKNNDTKTINNIYYKTCLNQFIVGSFIVLMLFININNIFTFLPSEYAIAKNVLLLIAFANLINMLSGASGIIILTSKYYWFFSVLKIIMLASIIGFNTILLPKMGITGVAFAAFISYIIFNVVKFIFIWIKFEFQPYDHRYLIVILICMAAGAAGFFIPEQNNIIIDIVLRSAVMMSIYVALILFLKISTDINLKANEYLSIFKSFLKK